MSNTTVELKDIREIEEITLPRTGGVVSMHKGLLFGDTYGANIEDQMETGKHLVKKLINDWNFADSNGEKMPINDESLGLLPIEDMNLLMEKASSFIKSAQKKKDK